MSTLQQTDNPPASISVLRPPKGATRRASLASLSSVHLLDKETVSLALDQIHNTASQSDALTTFNEYAAPPPSFSNQDNKSVTVDLQGGISGLYNRIRASVSNQNETEGPVQSETKETHSISHSEDLKQTTLASGTPSSHRDKSPDSNGKEDADMKRRGKFLGSQVENARLHEQISNPQISPASDRAIGHSDHRTIAQAAPQPEQKKVRPSASTSISQSQSSYLRTVESSSVKSGDASENAVSGGASPPHPDEPPSRRSGVGPSVVNERLNVSINNQPLRDGSGQTQERPIAGQYQHLEIPVRKSQSRTDSLLTSSSRGSSQDNNKDSPLAMDFSEKPNSQNKRTRASSTTSPSASIVQRSLISKTGARTTVAATPQAKSKLLSRDYWMKDENAKDCFGCGDAFSTFRRKHHCRTCGQIFDAKCTSVISGNYFNQSGTLRVCKPCEGIIKGEDDSSEASDDGNYYLPGFRPRFGSSGAMDTSTPTIPESSTGASEMHSPMNPDLGVPTMSIPATRKAGEKATRKPAVLEIESERVLTRPSSSRSLKSAFGGRPLPGSHKRHNSRNQFPRLLRSAHEDNAPFHQGTAEAHGGGRLGTFHDDNIIDPELAPYLSDEQSSGDEQVSLMAALSSEQGPGSFEERSGWDAATLSGRRTRFRFGDKSASSVAFAGKDSDAQSLTAPRPSRPGKRRTFSTSSQSHLRPSPRNFKGNVTNYGSTSSLRDSISNMPLGDAVTSENQGNLCRMLRSSSMRGASAPRIELNDASVQHVRRLLTQLLVDSNVEHVPQWENALLPILFRATDDVCPDVQNGDDMDIRHYVKLKKIPGGKPGDTAYVSGLVFTKNLALKTMPRSISHPNILILTFPLEYARQRQHFMSLEPVIRQEKEFLQNVVNRIAALRPHLLLVERHVSGLALDYLEQASIATAYNVKASVLEAVARCCQTRIISSIDKLAIRPAQAGKCASFYLKTYIHSGRKKTYMFLSGTSKELGCTIVLRGADNAILRKIKRVTEFMVYVVYNLKLETCLMRDEQAVIPEASNDEGISAGIQTKSERCKITGSDAITSTISGREASEKASAESQTEEGQSATDLEKLQQKPTLPDEDSVPDDIPMPTFYTNMVEEHRRKILSASPFVQFMQPYLLMRAREQERRLDYLKRLRDQDIVEISSSESQAKPERFDLITPEMVHKRVPHASKKVREVLYAVHDAEYDKALYNYQTQSKQWETNIAGNLDMFNPFAHQNIALLYSVVCTSTTVPCSGPDMVALSFYNEHETDPDFEADCTLGQYVEDLCIGAGAVCTANGCEKLMIEHHRQYVHGGAQVSVFIEPYPCKLVGFSDTILMWSTCRKCGIETEVKHMSENTWKYSFGKYLELRFWSTQLKAQVDTCAHDIHRDFLHYFGFKDLAVRVHYDSIKLLEIIVPRARITWKVDHDLRFRNDVFVKIETRLNKFMNSVKTRVKGISAESVLPEKAEACKKEIEKLSRKATEDHLALLLKLQDRYMSSKHYEVIPLNRAIRSLQEKVVEWDNAFSDFDHNFFPSEKDIRRLATLQLKKIFLDRDDSTASLVSESSEGVVEVLDEKNQISGEDPTLQHFHRLPPKEGQETAVYIMESDKDSVNTMRSDTQVSNQTRSSAAGADQSVIPLPMQDVEPLDLAADRVQLERSSADSIQIHSTQASSSKAASASSPIEAVGHDANPTQAQESVTSNPAATPNMPSSDAKQPVSILPVAPPSAIPKPSGAMHLSHPARKGLPALNRAQTQPILLRDNLLSQAVKRPEQSGKRTPPSPDRDRPMVSIASKNDRSVPDRLGLQALKNAGMNAHSLIPLSINSKRRESRVSNLAKHFEQLSREFEKERLKERKERAMQNRRSRAHPLRASKPIVQIYRNVNEAVEEKVQYDEDLLSSDPSIVDVDKPQDLNPANSQTTLTSSENLDAREKLQEPKEAQSKVASDAEVEGNRSDDEPELRTSFDAEQTIPETKEDKIDLKLDLPKHEKTSLMKILTNFWAERSASGWEPLAYPLQTTDHIFADSDIIVREDEPSSLIAFALSSEDYQKKLGSIVQNAMASAKNRSPTATADIPETPKEKDEIEEALLRPTGTHLKYQFSEGSAKMLCKIFYTEQFDALRRKCGVDERMAESLSRCLKWDSKGGKTNSVFLKSLDDRFVLKSLSPIETQAFLKFAPAYFRIISETLFHDLPSVIAKMLGFYQIVIKNPATGVDFNWFLLVMENLFYDRSPNRIFDLKGSMRNRRIQSTGEQNEVLLDENMVEFIYESPLFAREHSKKLLRASVWNDTLFLSRQNVMDYSLMIAIDETKNELVVGIIDCIRTYTWDKKLESWIKDRGKNRPTVTSPKEYKSRFREAMGRYVLQAPNCWHQFKAQLVERSPQRPHDDPGDDKEAHLLEIA